MTIDSSENGLRQQRMPKFMSQSEDNIVAAQSLQENNLIMIAAEHLNLNQNAGESVLNPMQQSLIFTSAEI